MQRGERCLPIDISQILKDDVRLAFPEALLPALVEYVPFGWRRYLDAVRAELEFLLHIGNAAMRAR